MKEVHRPEEKKYITSVNSVNGGRTLMMARIEFPKKIIVAAILL